MISGLTFPSSRWLPPLLHAEHWIWHPPSPSLRFWIGEDAENRQWLVKMRGGFYGLKERVFSIIAQALGISCQSSTFLKIPRTRSRFGSSSPEIRSVEDSWQLAIVFLEEHARRPCGDACLLEEFNRNWRCRPYDIDLLRASRIASAIDIARGQMLGMLCEMHEPPDCLFTREHAFVQIDNELMFSRSAGADLLESPWVVDANRRRRPSGIREAVLLCKQVLALPDEVYREAVPLPAGYRPKMIWNIKKEVSEIRPRAGRFLAWAANT
jgi:hypothetical protein